MATVEFKDIAHSYVAAPRTDDDWAIKPLRHRWQDGGAYALLGPSGCGKTTLLNIISGLLTPSKGELHFNGKNVLDAPQQQRNIAQVFQFPVVYDTMRVRDNLAFPLKNRGVAPAQVAARVEQVAALLEIDALLDAPAAGLSADAKQIVSLGRGLVREDINAILFDEPLTVVDPHIKWQLRSALKRLHQQTNFTMIYVTHDQTEALTFADEIAVMHDGRIVQSGAPTELFEAPRHTFVGHFIGSPGMNILPCRVDGARGDTVQFENHRVAVAPFDNAGNGKTELGVRPEFVRFCDGSDGGGIPASITRVQDIGRHRIFNLNIAGHDIKMLDDSAAPPPANVAVRFDATRAYLYEDGWRRGVQT